jgi:hypothetical protein
VTDVCTRIAGVLLVNPIGRLLLQSLDFCEIGSHIRVQHLGEEPQQHLVTAVQTKPAVGEDPVDRSPRAQ